MSRPSADWRLGLSALLFVAAVVLIWPTVNWYSMPELERDRAEASVQPETDNPHYRALLEEMRSTGGEAMLADYRDLYGRSRGTIKLGLDLQGGMYLSYIVEPVSGLDPSEAIDQALETIRNRVDEFGVSEPSITRQGEDRIVVQLPGVRDPARARAIVERQALLEFKLVAYPNARVSVPSEVPALAEIDEFLAASAAPPADSLTPPEADSAEVFSMPGPEQVLPDSVVSVPALAGSQAGIFTGLVQAADEYVSRNLSVSPGDWIIPAGEAMEQFQSLLATPGVDSILAAHNLLLVFGRETETPDGTFSAFFLVPRDATRGWDGSVAVEHPGYALTGASLTDVFIRMGDNASISSAPYLILEFDADGARNWERITGENVEERVGVILDGTIYSVAKIMERISGTSTRLSGGFSVEEARDLRLVLKAGSLPARLVLAEEQTIGPSLGREALSKGLLAGIIGFAIVVAFMIAYYGTGGLIASAALVLNMLLIGAALCFPGPLASLGVAGLGATLTLPGIAGIVLTIGMAVDANVLIFERIREERRSGKGIRPAVEAGFARAFTTILDSNLTTLITALILYRFGTGPVRGFAVTLSIGILASLFCSLVFSRGVFDAILNRKSVRDISLGRPAFFRGSSFSFTSARRKAYLVSLLVILAGGAAFALSGGFRMAIDFTGGLETTVLGPEGMTVTQLRSSLFDAGLEGVQVQELQDWAGTGRAFVVRTATMDAGLVNSTIEAQGCSPMESTTEEASSWIRQIGPRVGQELRSRATSAVLLSWLAIILYVWYRFQLKWGFTGVLALVHDTLITLGFIAVMRIEVSLTIIAAILTIIGYSINDTIVVFDRIRENRRLRKGRTFEETVDLSINETLGRTVITALTTFLAVLALFIFGVGEIADFALTMCVGLITGTYSSIFVASALLVDWRRRRAGA